MVTGKCSSESYDIFVTQNGWQILHCLLW